MKILVIGGTGLLSSATVRRALEVGHDVTVITRGRSTRGVPAAVELVQADVSEPGRLKAAVSGRRWDAAVDFIAFCVDDVQRDIDALRGRVDHYIYISSASVYQPRPMRIPFRESTPVGNPFWAYPRSKAAAESLLLEEYHRSAFPGTVVRPSHTYDETAFPTLGGWTDVARMRSGQPVLVHGDGTSVRTLTHASDFAVGLVGLVGVFAAIGDTFHITSDELLTWNDIYETVALAAGAKADLVHVAAETIVAANPELQGPLLGDRAHSKIFDNTKIRTLVPMFRPSTTFSVGARQLVEYWDARPELQVRDARFDRFTDHLVSFARSITGVPT